jgi:hypothetical protein
MLSGTEIYLYGTKSEVRNSLFARVPRSVTEMVTGVNA